MRCSACEFWKKSQAHGSHCVCMAGIRPCDLDRKSKVEAHFRKRDRRRRRYGNYDDE